MFRIEKTYRPYIILLLFALPLFFINVHSVHNWGDDFAQYIKEAENIANGKPYYESTYIFNPQNLVFGPPQYPPGFPLILAPVVKIWGLSIKALSLFMSFLLACLMFTIFAYYRKYASDAIAICLSLLCVYSVKVLDIKADILSNIPGWLFIALYLLVRQRPVISRKHILLLVLLATMAILIRSQSLLIIIAEGIYLGLLSLKEWYRTKRPDIKQVLKSPSFIIVISTIVLVLILNNLIFAAPGSSLSFYMNMASYRSMSVWEQAGVNAANILEQIITAYQYQTSDLFLNVLTRIASYLVFAMVVIGYIKMMRKRLDVADIFFILLPVFLCYFSQSQGILYLLPILHLYLLYALIAARDILPSLLQARGKKIAIVITVVYMGLGYNDFEVRCRPVEKKFYNTLFPEDLKTFAYVRQHVGDSDIIVFEKSRCLALFTGKRAITVSRDVPYYKNRLFFDSLRVKYLLTCSDFNHESYIPFDYIRAVGHPLDSTAISPRYTLYRIR